MSAIIKRIAQKYVSGLSPDDLAKITQKTDVTPTMYDSHNPKFGEKDSPPVPKDEYVHRSKIITGGYVHFNNIHHRQMVAYYHPWMKGYLEKVSKALWSTVPVFCKPGSEGEEEPEIDETITQFWNDNRLQGMLKKSWEKSQTHGICFYYPMNPAGFFDGYSGPPWYVYSKDELGQPAHFIQGHPYRWAPNHSNKEKSEPKVIVLPNGVFYDYKNTDDFTGEPFGIGIWDLLIDWIYMEDAVNSFDQRMGNGFFTMVVPNATTPEEITSYESIIRKMRTEKGMVIRGSVDEPVELTWAGMANVQVDFITHMEKLEDLIAFNMSFPKRWIMGDSPGAIESGGIDHMAVKIQLKNLFNEWIIYIKRVLIYHGMITDLKDIHIRAPYEMQLSEEEKIGHDKIKTDTIGAKTWLSVNEQRALDGYDPVAEEGADDVMVQEEPEEEEGENGPPKEENPDEPKTDVYDVLSEIFTNEDKYAIRQLARITGRSPTTISNIRNKFDDEMLPHEKVDMLTIKEDSVQISDNIYEYSGIVLRPQEKEYKHLNRTCVLSKTEIDRIYNDPTYPKEFRIGVTKGDDHSSAIRSEVLESNAIGNVQYKRLTDEGVYGTVRIDLNKTDKVIGDNNWIREKTNQGQFIPMSVARWTVDKPKNGKWMEGNVDIRSYVATRQPRNKEIGVQ